MEGNDDAPGSTPEGVQHGMLIQAMIGFLRTYESTGPPPVALADPMPSPALSHSNHTVSPSVADRTADRLSTAMGLSAQGRGGERRPIFAVGEAPPGREPKRMKPTKSHRKAGECTFKRFIFYGPINSPKKGSGNGVTAIMKDDKVELHLDRVHGRDIAMYKKFLTDLKCSDSDTWQSFLRRVVASAMPAIIPMNETSLDLFASALLIFVHNSESTDSSLQLLERLESGMNGALNDSGRGWVTTPMSLYKRVRTGQNVIHLVMDPAFVYGYWTALPVGVRTGLHRREEYKEAHRRNGGSVSRIESRPMVLAESATVANQTAGGNIVPAGQNGSCACM